MKKHVLAFVVLLPLCVPHLHAQGNGSSLTAGDPVVSPTGTYKIGIGDVLQVTVWKQPDASVAGVQVRNDGYISLPFVREILVKGLTTTEVEALVAEKLVRYIREPEVSILVKELNSEKIYLVGAVKREGPLPLKSSMTVLQAILEAGGVTDFAKRKKVYVLRTVAGRPSRIPFDFDAAVKGLKPEQNILVQPGDTIVIPR